MNQQQQPTEFTPFKVESDDVIRDFKVEDNGDVVMTETVKSKVWFHGREFMSFYRSHVKDKETLEKALSKEAVEDIKKNIEKNKKAIAKLDPFVKEVEVNLKITYEKQLLEGKTNGLKAELAKKPKDRKPGFAEAIWFNLSDKEKPKVMEKLTAAEKAEIVNFKVQQKKKEKRNPAKAQ